MTERVIVFQSNNLETFFWALDPQDPESEVFRPVEQINALTPYGMLLASLGSATAQLLHTYAQKHGMSLEHVELHLQCGTPFPQGTENLDGNGTHSSKIEKQIALYGTLSPEEHVILLGVANRWSVFKMLEDGTEVKFLQAQE